MNEYICPRCKSRSYYAAIYENLINKNCGKCGTPVYQSFSRGNADKKPKGDNQMKETSAILREQMKLLSEESKRRSLAPAELCGLSCAMVEISRALFECSPLDTFRPESAGRPNEEKKIAVTLTSKAAREIQWEEIKKAAERGTLIAGDEISFLLKNGSPATVTVADVKNGRAYMIFSDCVAERPMYEKLPKGRVSWKGSGLRRWANEEFIAELPDDLVSIIIPRKIAQTVDGETLETEDRLWAPSVTELFGRREWAAGDDQSETQFPIFKNERARVKMLDSETVWYWTRSPNTGGATYFIYVNTSGSNNNSGASSSYGVCLGLCV